VKECNLYCKNVICKFGKTVCMSTEKLKQEFLNVVREELVAYQTEGKEVDDLSNLCDEDRAELEEQDKEDPFKDTITEEEFKQHIEEWRIRLSTKRDS